MRRVRAPTAVNFGTRFEVKTTKQSTRFMAWSLAALGAITLMACASAKPPMQPVPQPAAGVPLTDPRVPSVANSPANQERLEALWEKRSSAASNSTDYPIGPGDVIEVEVPGVDDLK